MARAGPGGVFGEMALVDQSVRAATATAETPRALLAGLAERAKDMAVPDK